ncbi:invasion associated locus B family protein [Mesorhizobium sp. NBSH29]|nr:invasion associated locus B family protein [Mesorhizobium sp. NBSH29]
MFSTRSLHHLAALAASTLLVAGTALAQEAPAAESAKGDRPANAWIINCASGANTTNLECQMSQNLTEQKTGQRVLTVTLRKQPKEDGYTMLLALPHGLYIPAGASYQIDASDKKPAPVQTSDQNGAYAAVVLDAAGLKALKAGTTLNIGMESTARQPITIPVSLTGFSAAVDKLATLN